MEDDTIIWLVKQLDLSLDQDGRKNMRIEDITPSQGLVLSHLLAKEGTGLYATNLHVESGISKAAISSILKELKKKGYLNMEANPEDDRKKQIILTQKAYNAEKRLEEHVKRQQERLCAGISQQNLEILNVCLNTMILNLRPELKRRSKT